MRSTCSERRLSSTPARSSAGVERGQPGALRVAAGTDLRHEPEALGVRVQRLADEVVDDVGAVVLRGVDVVDAELDRAPEHGAGGVGVARRSDDAGAGELHGAEADPVDGLVAEEGGLGHGSQAPLASTAGQEGERSWDSHHHPPVARSSRSSCGRSASARRPRASAWRVAAGGARRACGARRSPSSPGSGCPGTRGSSRAATSRRRRACSTRSRASSTSIRPSARTSSTSPASPCRPRRGVPHRGAARARRRRRGARAQPRLPAGPAHRHPGLEPRRDPRCIGTPTQAPDGATNLLRWLFTDPGRRADPPGTARNTLARFRAEHARRYDDPAFTSLIGELLEVSPAFRELWPRHEVLDAQLGTKQDRAPGARAAGRSHHLQSIPTSHPDLRLTQFVPGDARTRAALGG